jgi:hypothetical protein
MVGDDLREMIGMDVVSFHSVLASGMDFWG